jgi:NAD(P) transhydrogenase subunit alpha
MIERMKAGSVVVDMSVETGGNVECSRLGEQVEINGVQILGYPNLPGRVPRTASQMYSNNIGNLVEHFWRKETRAFRLDPADPILEKCVVAHGDAIHHAPPAAPAPGPQPGTNFPL